MILLENVWWLLVLIGVMILIHELGHYWAARFFDVRVEAFSFGFGPRLFGFRKGETDFRFSAILFGGYVKMSGEQPGDEAANDPRAFLSKPRWQRLIIAFAGPAMNIVLALGLLTGLFMVHFEKPAASSVAGTIGYVEKGSAADKAGLKEGDRIVQVDNQVNPSWQDIVIKEVASAKKSLTIGYVRDNQREVTHVTPALNDKTGLGDAGWDEEYEVEIAGVMPGMDAEKAGLKRGDIVVSVNGTLIRSTARLHEMIRNSNGQPVQLTFLRNGQQQTISIKPAMSTTEGTPRYMIGVQLERRVVVTSLPFPEAIRESVKQNVKYASLIYQFLGGIVERRMSPKSIEGPIRIAQISGEAAREGPLAFCGLMSSVSLNLAIFNLLPIPILDGGMILMLLIEILIRRDLSLQVKENFLKVGMVFLMAVVVFVLYNDISKILPQG